MDFLKSIEDVFGIFAVGIFTLLSCYSVYGIACCKIESIKEFYKNLLPTASNEGSTKSSKPTTVTNTTSCPSVLISVFAVFIFGLGLIIQDTADKYTDTSVCGKKDSKNIVIRLNNHFKILKNEFDLRFNTLLNVENGKFKLNSLGTCIFKYADFLISTNHNFTEEQKKFLNYANKNPFDYVSEEFTKDDIAKVTSTVYYRSKNWAFSQPTYYDELRNLQNRVDFSRSILLISTLTIVGLIIAFLFSIVPMIIKTKQKNTSFTKKNHFKNLIIFLLILFIIGWLSRTGYDNSERNFNERVIGYYVTFLDNYPLYHSGGKLSRDETGERREKGTTGEVPVVGIDLSEHK